MAVTIEGKVLNKALTRLTKIVKSSPQFLPALSCFALEARSGTGLKITASNVETTATVTVPASGELPRMLVSASFFRKVVSRSSSVCVDAGGGVAVDSELWTLQTAPVEDWPKGLDVVPSEWVEIEPDRVESLRWCAGFSSDDDSRPVLTCVYWDAKEVAGTDSYRLGLVENGDSESPFADPLLVPASFALSLPSKVPVSFGLSPGTNAPTLHAKAAGVSMSVKTIDSDFPRYRSLIPTVTPDVVRVDRDALLSTASKVEALASAYTRSPLRVRYAPSGFCSLSFVVQDLGSMVRVLRPGSEEDARHVGFNAGYLASLLKGVTSTDVELCGQDGRNPWTVRYSVGQRERVSMIMPVRIA